jgi:hypothetical protein
MKKIFIIGTGRNGSKLCAKVLSTAINDSNIFGEVHSGLMPKFFKDAYHGLISKSEVVRRFKQSRDHSMRDAKGFYVEKNHLIVPILDQIKEAYPDALFIYVDRYSKDIVRSFLARDTYSGTKTGMYEEGRLTPAKDDPYFYEWNNFSQFEKICWYVDVMKKMCIEGLDKMPSSDYIRISYELMVAQPNELAELFFWLDLTCDFNKIEEILSRQWGSSARSPEEVGFRVIDEKKFKRTPHWGEWSEEQNEAYRRFFGG